MAPDANAFVMWAKVNRMLSSGISSNIYIDDHIFFFMVEIGSRDDEASVLADVL